MKDYIVQTPLRIEPGKPAIEVGAVVSMTAKDGDELIALGALRVADTVGDSTGDDLAKLGVKALVTLAEAEGVTMPEKSDKASLVAAIEAHRIEAAKAAADGASTDTNGKAGSGQPVSVAS